MIDLRIVDDDGRAVELDKGEAAALLALAEGLERATTSACPDCRSRVVSVVALTDLLDSGLPHPRSIELVELADDAPTLHLYVVDAARRCAHRRWRDPGHEEWVDVVAPPHPARRRP